MNIVEALHGEEAKLHRQLSACGARLPLFRLLGRAREEVAGVRRHRGIGSSLLSFGFKSNTPGFNCSWCLPLRRSRTFR